MHISMHTYLFRFNYSFSIPSELSYSQTQFPIMKILETIRFIILNNVYKVGGTIHKVCHYVNLFVMYSQYSDI